MKIICIGRNYAEHAKELNHPVPEEPLIFLKPETALIPRRHPFYIPAFSNEIHHEVELVLRICRPAKKIQAKFAYKYYNAIGIGIDFTARDVQKTCREKGLPWDKAKAFDHSAPVSPDFIPVEAFPDVRNIDFHLTKNGRTVQRGNSGDLQFDFDRIIAYASQYFMLKQGDLIFTGTPAGVGKVAINDVLECFIGNRSMMRLNIK